MSKWGFVLQDMKKFEGELRNLQAALEQAQAILTSPEVGRLSLKEQLSHRQVAKQNLGWMDRGGGRDVQSWKFLPCNQRIGFPELKKLGVAKCGRAHLIPALRRGKGRRIKPD